MKQNDFIDGYVIGIIDFQEQLLKLIPTENQEQLLLPMKTIGDLLIDRAKVSNKLNKLENENKRNI